MGTVLEAVALVLLDTEYAVGLLFVYELGDEYTCGVGAVEVEP